MRGLETFEKSPEPRYVLFDQEFLRIWNVVEVSIWVSFIRSFWKFIVCQRSRNVIRIPIKKISPSSTQRKMRWSGMWQIIYLVILIINFRQLVVYLVFLLVIDCCYLVIYLVVVFIDCHQPMENEAKSSLWLWAMFLWPFWWYIMLGISFLCASIKSQFQKSYFGNQTFVLCLRIRFSLPNHEMIL